MLFFVVFQIKTFFLIGRGCTKEEVYCSWGGKVVQVEIVVMVRGPKASPLVLWKGGAYRIRLKCSFLEKGETLFVILCCLGKEDDENIQTKMNIVEKKWLEQLSSSFQLNG